jgi:iron complex outermembrane receptor protein
MGDVDLLAGRGALSFTPTNDFDLVFAIDAARRDEHAVVHRPTDIVVTDPNFVLLQAYNTFIAAPFGSPLLNVTAACPDGAMPPAPSPVATSCTSPLIGSDPYSSQATSFNVSDLDVLGGSANATWDLGALTLRSITAYRTQESTSGADFDGGPLSFSEQIVNIETDTFSQELQLFGDAFDDRLSWLFGAYYSRESSDTDFTFLVAQPGFGPSINLLTTLDTTSFAAFASGTWRLTDRLSATAGVRYSRDERETEDNANFVSNPFLGGAPSSFYAAPGPGPFPGIPNFFPFGTIVTGEDSWENVSPRLSLEFQASEGAFLYASVAQGYKSGSFNGRPLTGSLAPTAYDPEQVTTYELGWKLDLFDRHLRVNTSMFNTIYDDIQVTILVADGPLVNTPTVNAGEAEVRGFEFELQAAPTDEFRLDASLGYVDAEFTELNAPSSFPGAVIPFGTDAAFAQTPEWTASLGAQYSFDLAGGASFIIRGDANYRDQVYFNVPNLDEASQDGFTLLNARATYESADGAWRLAVFGTNLGEETYKTFAFGAFGIVTSYFGAPREWGVSLSRSF